MTRTTNRRSAAGARAFVIIAAGITIAVISIPAAIAQGGRWSARVSGVWLSPTGDQITESRSGPGDGTLTLDVSDEATGYGLAILWRLRPRLSVETGVQRLDMDTAMLLDDSTQRLSDVGTMSISSVHLAANWHLTPGRRADLCVGGIVSQTSFKDVIYFSEVGLREKRTFDDDIGFGVKAVVEVPLGESAWSLFGELRYLDMILEGEAAGQDLDFNPTILAVGLSYGF